VVLELFILTLLIALLGTLIALIDSIVDSFGGGGGTRK